MTEGKGSCGCGGSEMHSHEKDEKMEKKEMQGNREKENSTDVGKADETGKMGGSSSDKMETSEQQSR